MSATNLPDPSLWCYSITNPNLKEIKMDKKKQDKGGYSFHVQALETQLDLSIVAEDLSTANPMALVEVDSEDGWMGFVLVHSSLARKAEIVLDLYDCFDPSGDYIYYSCDNARDFAWFIEQYSDVKAIPWPDKLINKAKVSVSFPRL